MKLEPNEKLLTGKWLLSNGRVVADDTCHRIMYLVNEHLKKVATSQGGWDTLYMDPTDGRLWELTFPDSGLHGGGPPQLRNLTFEEARQKYEFDLGTR